MPWPISTPATPSVWGEGPARRPVRTHPVVVIDGIIDVEFDEAGEVAA